MAAGFAEIALALTKLPIFLVVSRLQPTGTYTNLLFSGVTAVDLWKNGFCYRAPFPAKRGNAPGGARVGGTRRAVTAAGEWGWFVPSREDVPGFCR